MEEKKSKRGGKREGAGRKKGVDTNIVSIKLETELCDILAEDETVTNRSKFINYAVRFVLMNRSSFDEFVKTLREQE